MLWQHRRKHNCACAAQAGAAELQLAAERASAKAVARPQPACAGFWPVARGWRNSPALDRPALPATHPQQARQGEASAGPALPRVLLRLAYSRGLEPGTHPLEAQGKPPEEPQEWEPQ